MMILNPEAVRAAGKAASACTRREGWLSGTALAGRIGAVGLGAAGLLIAAAAQANPVGGQVVAGQADIVQTAPDRLDITQSTQKAIINWGQFSIGEGETTNFIQPGSNSVTLNRVTGGDPSQILGSLTANGNVILLNQNGILFGPNSRIDVGGLIASTANISNDDFMAGNYRFEGAPQGSWVVNQGRMTVKEGGLAALVAPGVENSGVIEAKLGSVSLASGTAFTVDLYGDGLVSLAVGGQVTQSVTGPEGEQLAALVSNDGTIVAEGGTVLMTADAAAGVVDSVINMGGVVQARSVGQDASGAIVLDGGEHGIVEVSGTLDASGAVSGQKGGAVTVTGELVALRTGAALDASGSAGGGQIKVGGDYQGTGTTPTARRTVVQEGASLSADALDSGDGGRVIVWADENTIFSGHLSAKGGANGGNGGFAEISGKENLAFRGTVDLTAAAGNAGTILFDPKNITIAAMGGQMTPASINARDNFGEMPNANVTFNAGALGSMLTTGATVLLEANNDITVDGAITAAQSGNLSLDAGRSIILNNSIALNGGNLTLTANTANTNLVDGRRDAGAGSITGTGSLSTNGGNLTIRVETVGAAPGVSQPGAISLSGVLSTTRAAGNAGSVTVTGATGQAVSLGNIIANGAAGGGGGAVTVTTNGGTLTVGNVQTRGGDGAGTAGGDAGAVTLNSAGGLTMGSVQAFGGNGTLGGDGGDVTLTGTGINLGGRSAPAVVQAARARAATAAPSPPTVRSPHPSPSTSWPAAAGGPGRPAARPAMSTSPGPTSPAR